MMVKIFRLCLTLAIFMILSIVLLAQVPGGVQKRNPRGTTPPKTIPTPQNAAEQNPPDDQKEIETVKINTNLVVVPIIATDRNGIYVPDLQRNEFSVEENGAKQEIAFFASVSAPFYVVLMLDTSASTQDKLGLIQKAATSFVEQLQSGDRVKVISFDDEVRDLNEFTNDRAILKAAINKTRPGQGTKLYDAMELALSSVNQIQGRKAIVLFSDGVDWHSVQASFAGTLRGLDEQGAIVYPIRYDTRAETEQIAQEQAEDITPRLPTLEVIRRPPSGTTAPTFPGEGPDTVPTTGTRPKTGPLGLPLPSDILRPRPEMDPNRLPSPNGLPPPTRDPRTGRVPDRGTYPDPRSSKPSDTGGSISAMLDSLYLTADSYLKALAEKSGGRVVRADTLVSLPDAFGKIAAELRTQYSLGYYPSNKAHDDTYRKIRITTTRKDLVIRARPGYHAPPDR